MRSAHISLKCPGEGIVCRVEASVLEDGDSLETYEININEIKVACETHRVFDGTLSVYQPSIYPLLLVELREPLLDLEMVCVVETVGEERARGERLRNLGVVEMWRMPMIEGRVSMHVSLTIPAEGWP